MTLSRRSFGVSLLLLAVDACRGNASAATATPTKRKATKLIASARSQIGITVQYDPAYTALSFPNGDVPRTRGVCTDVVIRAYRDAFGIDLQALVHADMAANFAAYPQRWGQRQADQNIDHRRVPNLQTFLRRQGAALHVTNAATDWRPGDLVTSLIGGRLPHIGIVSDRSSRSAPMVIHNIGAGTREENALFAHTLTGHFRWEVG
jgi:uncharacterized protein